MRFGTTPTAEERRLTRARGRRRRSSQVLAVFLLAMSTAGEGAETARIARVSSKPFPSTIEHLEWQPGGYGITVVARLDYQSILGKVDVRVGKSQTIEILRRSWANVVLDSDAAAAINLPLRIYVHEREDGKTVVSYYCPSSLFADHANEALIALGRELDTLLEGIVRLATK